MQPRTKVLKNCDLDSAIESTTLLPILTPQLYNGTHAGVLYGNMNP